jgi:hypothetical protein
VELQCRNNDRQVLICKHCNDGVFASNITRRKQHLLACQQFLDTHDADDAAGSCPQLKVAVDAHRCVPGVRRGVLGCACARARVRALMRGCECT